MHENNQFNEYIAFFRKNLGVGESFDVGERKLIIGGKESCIYYIEGFIISDILQEIISDFFSVAKKDMDQTVTAMDFIKSHLPYAQVTLESNTDKMVKAVLSGLIILLVDGYSEAMIIDLRTYPVRGIEEPEKEKSLRGPKDGFVETLMFNTKMIRRRIRDTRLVFEMHTIGSASKTDVCVTFMKGIADEKVLEKIRDKMKGIRVDTLTVGDQSLVEAIAKSQWLNPFPKVRYTQRPDVVAAHLTEGKVAILVDNSPTVILIPTSIFDFLQDTDDYYFPILTGNYFRMLRIMNMLAVIFLTPAYLLIAEEHIPVPDRLDFFIPDEGYAIPLFAQFILLEFAIDALKLASLNTPSSLGMSLSVIGALILGQFSIDSGWFIPQTILCMAVLALASFTQPSIELGYAIKFMRILILVGVAVAGVYGAVAGIIINIIALVKTKNIIGVCYLYPLYPFDWKILKRLVFRTRKDAKD
ncbi:spore germination protein [Sinanaerobacter chloroacetimidivorans]|jgi:stage V sporulation protein AF|uniref:Spore germination protein n=1 Tax=Sinanaerobacter chloroacetimidivorans TaxID=2818044 RepID=A0A8J7W447_9FIRM|nr:spore germination protein [Sinanaerobacter chloroacetimidivorans]MBR0598788.1 spore germination protein [Sinanaerobacter chloroacetimidivorans]